MTAQQARDEFFEQLSKMLWTFRATKHTKEQSINFNRAREKSLNLLAKITTKEEYE